MDTTLVSVTLLSMAMAASLSVIVWRMVRDDRRRSEARVQALAELAATPSDGRPSARSETRREPHALVPPRRPRAVQSRPGFDLPLNATSTPTPTGRPLVPLATPAATSAAPLFVEPATTSPWATRAAIIGALVLAVAAAVLFALAARMQTTTRTIAGRGPIAAASQPVAIDLLSLRDSREPGTLTISGLVHNPAGGIALSRVVVVAYTFDKDGAPLASGRSRLDAATLEPGGQSRFAVSVPATDAVARYRIGFRTDDGRVIAHVDRRETRAVAANW